MDNVDENGRLTRIEAKIEPDDLQRNVDLSSTEAGGQLKDEAHMTESEKNRRLGSEQAAEP